MATQEKISAIAELKDRIENNEIAVLTQYVGINVEQVTNLRKSLRESGIEYKVYKNTLAKRALQELGLEEVSEAMEGPTAWAFSKDPVAPAKILKEFSKKIKFLSMSGGVLNGNPVSKDQLQALADLPSREQLLAQVAGTVAAPLRNFVGLLSALPRDLVNTLEALRKKREEEGAAAA